MEASDAVVIGFNVRPTPQARQQAETDEVEIRLHSIIYKVIENRRCYERILIRIWRKNPWWAIIRETFKVSKLERSVGSWLLAVNAREVSASSVIVLLFSMVNWLVWNTLKMMLKKSETLKGGLMIEEL